MKIITRTFGGLGNQLFCYAAGRRLALVNNAELVIDDESGFARDHEYMRHYQLDHFNIPCRKATAYERLEPFSRSRRFLKRRFNSYLPFAARSYIQQDKMDFDPRLLQLQPRGVFYLEGYWQSENYFKDVEMTIRTDLRINPPDDALNHEMFARISSCLSVAVHFRFFDNPIEKNLNNAPDDYYSRAIALMGKLKPGAHYFIFSDKPAIARAHIPLPDAQITLISHNLGDANAYADLWLMTHCQHFIIANSTFSWWGAWLGEQSGKQVIAPGFKMKSGKMLWGFKGLLPESWIRL